MNPQDYLSPEELERYIQVMKSKNPNYDINNKPGLEELMEREERLCKLARMVGLC